MHVGDKATYYPGNECDRGIVAECNRGGCPARCVARTAIGPAGPVDLIVFTHDGKELARQGVPVVYPPEYDPPYPPEEVDPPHGKPYCRPSA
jgi:hypothetical protein